MTMNMFLMIYMCGFESDSSADDLTVYITHIPKHMYMIASKNTHNCDILFGEYNWCQLMKLSAMWQVHCLNPGGFGVWLGRYLQEYSDRRAESRLKGLGGQRELENACHHRTHQVLSGSIVCFCFWNWPPSKREKKTSIASACFC